MKAYIVVESNIIDADKLAQYSAQAAPTLSAYQGRFLAKGAVEPLHGAQPFAAKAIIEFPSAALAKEWYNSPEYQALIELRNQAIESQFQLVAGI